MAFFNYSNMQMTAKVVYYGPGLCGKTTNLQFIHAHTTDESRGEMVSLETQTDRTLFFDLLPLEVGAVAGFKARIQLYTVPGQVFYNTTRKLVLKGVDGIVFVADSQPQMMQANEESLRNLEDNLAGLGISLDEIPIVLQYNKRDLEDVVLVADLERGLNRRGWPSFESSALTGVGVFETLRGVSKVTLIALKKQLETSPQVPVAFQSAKPQRAEALARPTSGAAALRSAGKAISQPTTQTTTQPTSSPTAAPGPAAEPAPEPSPPATPGPESTATQPTQQMLESVLSEDSDNGSANGRSLSLNLGPEDYARARRLLISLRLEDASNETIREVDDLSWEIERRGSSDELRLKLDISLSPEE